MGIANRNNEALVTQEYLKSILHYNHENGEFTWIIKPCKKVCIGDIAGYVSNIDGYIRTSINKKHYLTHRLAWLYMTGSWPEFDIDHIEGVEIPNFNKWSNLRDTDKNNWNPTKKKRSNTSGFTGVHWCNRDKRWIAKIRINYERICLGYFDTAEEASAAYEAAKIERNNKIT